MKICKQWYCLLLFCLSCTTACWSQDLPVKVLFENNELAPEMRATWKIETTEGATMKRVPGGIEFTIEAWREGRDMWPRIWFIGTPIDLSDYTKMAVEVENQSDTPQNIALGAQTSGSSQAMLLPAKSTSTVMVDLADGAPVDQSAVSEIMLYQYHPLATETFIVKKVSVIKNPDYVSSRAALQNQFAETQRNFATLEKLLAQSKITDERMSQTKALLQSTQRALEQRAPGYVRAVQKELLDAQQLIARTGMATRGADFWVWTSPLGVALRKGMLPSPQDGALKKIADRICLNQYKAICVNFSVAEKARTAQLQLDSASSRKLFSLRPTLFTKARDGSEVADAIGTGSTSLSVEIEPYQTQQVIVWLDTKTAGARAGKHRATLKVVAGDATQNIPIEIDVADVRLPDSTPLSIHNWAYFYMSSTPVTKGLEREAVANLRDYGVNTWSFDYSQVPLPQLNEAGEYAGLKPETIAPFRKVLELLQGNPEELFIVWLGFQRDEVRAALDKPGVLEGYLHDLQAILDDYKIPRNKRLLTFWDEPKLPEVRETVKWIRRVRAIDPTWQFYENGSVIPTDAKELQEIAANTEYWLPNWDQLFLTQPEPSKRYDALPVRHAGFYRCLMSRNNRGVNIYEYYRLMNWNLMQRGYDTLGFWVHNVGNEDQWDGTKGSSSGGIVVYSKDGQLLSSRRWELFREGMEDYKLAQVALGQRGVLDAAKNATLAKLCADVLANPDDPTRADAVRHQLIATALKQSKIKTPSAK